MAAYDERRISGFPRPADDYDTFRTAHSSTSVTRRWHGAGRKLKGETGDKKRHVVAVSATRHVAAWLRGLNNAG